MLIKLSNTNNVSTFRLVSGYGIFEDYESVTGFHKSHSNNPVLYQEGNIIEEEEIEHYKPVNPWNPKVAQPMSVTMDLNKATTI